MKKRAVWVRGGGGAGEGGTHSLSPRLNDHPSLIKMIAVTHLHNIMLMLQCNVLLSCKKISLLNHKASLMGHWKVNNIVIYWVMNYS